jgi:hypothetical protein
MSYTEIRDEGGLRYGGLPHDEIARKLEETDPVLVREVSGADPLTPLEEAYKSYVRSEIVDWSPDEPHMEADHPSRDPARSRQVLNVLHSGGRGPNDYRLPQHPELFLGFTGNDPRGRDVGAPVLAHVRGHMAARGREKEVRMGENVGHDGFQEAHRPWAGMPQEYARKELMRQQRARMQWFPAEKVGRPWGRSTVQDEYYGLRQRTGVLRDGHEGVHVAEENQPGFLGPLYAPASRHPALGSDPAFGTEEGGVRGGLPGSGETAPWRNVLPEAELEAVRYQASGLRRRRESSGAGAFGGARAKLAGSGSEAVFGGSGPGQAINRRHLATLMSAAAAQRRAGVRAAEGDIAAGHSEEGFARGGADARLGRDVARAAQLGVGDQPRSAAVQEHTGWRAAGRGAPPADQQALLHQVEATHTPPAQVRLAAGEAMVRSLRAGTAADLRRVLGAPVAAGVRGVGLGDPVGLPHGVGAVPGADYSGVAARGTAALQRPGAGEMERAALGAQGAPQLADRVLAAQAGWSGIAAAPAGERAGFDPRSAGAPVFVSHTGEHERLGRSQAETFGRDAVGRSGGLVPVTEVRPVALTLADRGDTTVTSRSLEGFAPELEGEGVA